MLLFQYQKIMISYDRNEQSPLARLKRSNRTRGQNRLFKCQQIKICHRDKRPGAIAIFIENKNCSPSSKIQGASEYLQSRLK